MSPSLLLRRLLERVGSRMVFRRRLPRRFGSLPLWVSPSAALGYFRSLDRDNWSELYALAERHVRPGAVVWDIGANVGVFAFSAAHRAGATGSVVAVEADPWLASLVRRSAQIPGARAPVEVLCAAIADTVDLRTFAITTRSRSGSHIDGLSHNEPELVGAVGERHPVVTVSLDWLSERRPAPHLVKIDVEGAELLVLRGAEQLLRRARPVLMLECQENNTDPVTALLHAHDYALFEFDGRAAPSPRAARATYNTLAVPSESVQ